MGSRSPDEVEWRRMRLPVCYYPAIRWVGLLDGIMVSVFPTAGQEPPHNEEGPVLAGQVAQPRFLESEDPRPGGRPRRRRDLGSRLQAQRRAQQVAWLETDGNEAEAVIQGERSPSLEGKGTGLGGERKAKDGCKDGL